MKDYECAIGGKVSFWGDKSINESRLILYSIDPEDWKTKRYEYMEFNKMLEIAEKYLLLL
jgi:hypothetical protein